MNKSMSVIQALTDPENQPHQYVGKPVELAEAIWEIVDEAMDMAEAEAKSQGYKGMLFK